MVNKATEKSSATKKTYDKIYATLATKCWPAGTKLSPIYELAKEYEVSYLTAQKAIGMLQKAGVVACRRGDGTYLTGKRMIDGPDGEISSFNEHYSKVTTNPFEKSRETHCIGIVMPYWMSDCGALAFHKIVRGFLGRIDSHHWPVDMIYNVYHEAAKPDFLDKILQKHVDGIFWVAPQPEHKMNIMRLIDRGIAITSVGRTFPELPFSGVFADITDIAEKITDFCVANKSKKIILLISPIEGEVRDANSEVFVREMRRALAAKKIKLADDCIGQTAVFFPRNKITEVLTHEFLTKHPDADMIISYHETFFSVIEALDKQNFWKRPQSMFVVDVNAEFNLNRNHVGRIPVAKLMMPMENMGLAAAIELEKRWSIKTDGTRPDLSVQLIQPS